MLLTIYAILAIQASMGTNYWSLSTLMVVIDMPTTRIAGMTAGESV
jgi:hypothetical protein